MRRDHGNPGTIGAPRQGLAGWRKPAPNLIAAVMINEMPHYDFHTPRVYLDAPLAAGLAVSFDRGQANYLLNVLRLKDGDALLLFNGRDGEWQARLAGTGKRALSAVIGERM